MPSLRSRGWRTNELRFAMRLSDRDHASAALRDLCALPSWSPRAWEALIAQARSANLLSHLAARLGDAGLVDDVPAAPRAHLVAASLMARSQRDSVRRELDHLREALAPTHAEVVLLKGAAYLVAGLPMARGRMFTDVDVLVPRASIQRVEAALMLHGWHTTHLDAYDQRYYRQWMHELPPMRHATRATVVDVHHAILPTTARLHPDSGKLLADARAVPGEPLFKVLAPADMVLHSASHLFHNEELGQGLRDVVDLDGLLRDFARVPSFWRTLVERAHELDLGRPLHYALRYASAIVGTPVPPEIIADAARDAPARSVQPLMDALFLRALRPDHPSASDSLTAVARKLLYVRAHWLRMPMPLLVRHLAIKAVRREASRPQGAAV
jgi:hypothetical protein